MSPDPEVQADINSLVEWFTQSGGCLHRNVRIVHDQSRGFHAQAVGSIEAGTTVVECPINATLSVMNLQQTKGLVPYIQSPLARCIDRLPNDVLGYLVLIEQLVLDDASPWSHYIACLPEQHELTTTLWFSHEDCEFLANTDLLRDTQRLKEQLRKEWRMAGLAMVEAGMGQSETYKECDL